MVIINSYNYVDFNYVERNIFKDCMNSKIVFTCLVYISSIVKNSMQYTTAYYIYI